MKNIKFGTSGYRGVMGDTFTKEAVQRLGYALSRIANENLSRKPQIAIAYDNRFMSDSYAKWVAEVLAVDCDVVFFENAAPSPLASWYTKQVDYSVVLTASHNPYYYNGFKIFLDKSKECDDVFAKQVEGYANSCDYEKIATLSFDDCVKNGKVIIKNVEKEYCDAILSLVNVEKIKSRNLKILANAMHGNSVNCFKYLFEKLNLSNWKIINDNIDPYFEHKLPAPYLYNLTEQAKEVVSNKFDLGIAVDGDSDRFSVISSSGKIYDCNFVIAVLYYYYITKKGYKGAVVKNSALSNLVKLIAQKFGFDCYDAKVGFKHIARIMGETDAFIGAESNGVAFREHTYSKDGIYCAIALIDVLSELNQNLDDVIENLQNLCNFHSVSIEFAYPITAEKKEEIIKKLFQDEEVPNFNNKKIINVNREEGVKIEYEGSYWGMYRFSGNEPVIRIFSEMKDLDECNEMIACYEDFLGVKERQ